ncbi:major facilitator superfamily domain-containing protein 6 isoform X2 [Thrips palmi]|uniref:Major facilitator superfamily domain-containing protein 6 isoform X2 n=1 Tax=Thrips palmi TaxID=161013 RepID=A0A6P9AJ04_THRPL|nr:major facilitator superfamily domain-containing protein 6 isoform X2 [Thrips palmi]
MACSVDKSLLPMKAHYFLFNAGSAPIVPFLPVYARQLGFSSFVVGTIYAVLPIFGMLSKPLFGAVADYFKQQKPLFLLFQLLSAIALFTIQFVPEVPTKNPVELHCHQETNLVMCNPFDPSATDRVAKESQRNGTVLCHVECDIGLNSSFYQDLCKDWNYRQYCAAPGNFSKEIAAGFLNMSIAPSVLQMTVELPLAHHERVGNCTFLKVHNAIMPDKTPVIPYCNTALQKLNCNAVCDNSAVMDLITRPADENYSPAMSYQFWLFFFLLIVAWSSMAVVGSVGDAICFGMLGDKPNHFGQQRLWGAVGWGLFTVIAGFVVDELSKTQFKKDYTIAFYFVIFNVFLSIVVSYQLKYTQTHISRNILRDVGLMFSEARILVFIAWCIIVGINTGILWQFLFWHLEDLAGIDRDWIKALEGLAAGVQCFGGELPFFFLSGWIIKRLGHVHVMTLVLLSFGIRFILYSVLSNPWLCLPIELLQGVTFGLFYSTMASYASILSAPGTEATVQGLVGAVFEGIGVSLGSFIGGAVFYAYSGAVMFGIFGGLSVVFALLHAGIQLHLAKLPSSPAGGKGFKTVRYAPPSEANDACDDQQVLTST